MELKEGYKQTEVGVIPEDWESTQLGILLAAPPTYGINAPAIPYDTRYPTYLRITDITEDGRLDRSSKASVDHPASENYRLEVGDLVFARTGASVGKSYLYEPQDGDLTFAGFLIKVRPDAQKLSSRYLKYIANSQPYWDWVISNSMRSGQPGINGQQYASLPLPLPPTKAEQEAIAEALSDADALIESLEQLIAKKRQIKQGTMQELLTGERRLPGFSGEWEEKLLRKTATLKARIGWQGLTTAEYLESGDFYLVTGTDFLDGYIDWKSCAFVEESRYKQDKNIQLKKHDVLVTKDGTIGKVALIDDLDRPATLNSGVFVIRPIDESFDPEFFYYLLCSEVFIEFLEQLSAGSTINHLYQKDFVTFVYKTPPTIAEQTAIATILSDMDAEIAALETKLAKARQVKQGMMQELLTGNIRLI